ncbi:hypothetical protein V2J09_018030 [Rumex salicifolius]
MGLHRTTCPTVVLEALLDSGAGRRSAARRCVGKRARRLEGTRSLSEAGSKVATRCLSEAGLEGISNL